jgi:hypothetical protein
LRIETALDQQAVQFGVVSGYRISLPAKLDKFIHVHGIAPPFW